MTELTVRAAVDKLGSVLDFVGGQLEDKSLNDKSIIQIKIAVEEIFVNIASYAYPDGDGDVNIRIEFKNNSRVFITFTDSGVPFDPLGCEEPDITLAADERDIGGLGILMIKKSMDLVEYRYVEGQNRLTLVKAFNNEKK